MLLFYVRENDSHHHMAVRFHYLFFIIVLYILSHCLLPYLFAVETKEPWPEVSSMSGITTTIYGPISGVEFLGRSKVTQWENSDWLRVNPVGVNGTGIPQRTPNPNPLKN